jgi:cytochrome c biogenesis factor
MLISLLTLLLISNALTLRKDKSILFSRVVMVSLIHTSFLAYNLFTFNPKYLGCSVNPKLEKLILIGSTTHRVKNNGKENFG